MRVHFRTLITLALDGMTYTVSSMSDHGVVVSWATTGGNVALAVQHLRTLVDQGAKVVDTVLPKEAFASRDALRAALHKEHSKPATA